MREIAARMASRNVAAAMTLVCRGGDNRRRLGANRRVQSTNGKTRYLAAYQTRAADS